MAMVHISETELARDITGVLNRVQAGTEIVIERDAKPLAVLRPAPRGHRKLSEIAASMSEKSSAVLDPDFASDVQSFIDRHREPLCSEEPER
jgi:antitoxin (DNA-binding transcriptional repressor) of toxin-antitoxin stability system